MSITNLQQDCPKCHGSGFVPLSEGLDLTLGIMRSRPMHRWSASEIMAETPAGNKFVATAFNNRLKLLWKMGHIDRQREGREWIYTIPKSPTKQPRKKAK